MSAAAQPPLSHAPRPAHPPQSAGCDVTVYQNERSLGIEVGCVWGAVGGAVVCVGGGAAARVRLAPGMLLAPGVPLAASHPAWTPPVPQGIMSSWLQGTFRRPELFPGEAGDVSARAYQHLSALCQLGAAGYLHCSASSLRVLPLVHAPAAPACAHRTARLFCTTRPYRPPLLQYHLVVLPTFRDQHAEMVQYLLQLPRLRRQRYFLTQHNPGGFRVSGRGGGGGRWVEGWRGA